MIRSPHGFTLVELIVIVATIMLFMGISLGSYSSFGEQKKLEGESRTFVESIELAKKKIAAGDKPNDSCELSSMTITYDNTANSYSMIGQCPSDTTIFANKPLDKNVIFTTSGFIIFKPRGAATSFSSPCILLKDLKLNTCRRVTVELSGLVSEIKNDTCTCQN